MPTKEFASCLVALSAAAFVGVAVGHIKVFPPESTLGAREKYVMRVPNEKQVATVRIDGEFPAGLRIYSFESKPGWKVDIRKDASGNIVGASWIGSIAPLEFVEFGMLGINPQDGTQLIWKFVQHYADGMKEEFVGAAGSRLPAPTVTLRAAKK